MTNKKSIYTGNKANEGDWITFDAAMHNKKIKSHICNGKVVKVLQNSVMVDVTHEEVYEDQFTIVNHKNYEITQSIS